jgi:aspartyl-tRNA(Asn)/glutamyl-tRNA(Gln) amidotransferase subunit C
MSKPATVTLEDVNRVAELASLELQPEEATRMLQDLNSILGYIDQLNELDTSSVTPMAQVSELLGGSVAGFGETLRQDVVQPSIDRAAVMQSAPETDGRFFKVPKVIER